MTPAAAVAHYVSQQPEGTRFCVAYSGGMDSHVLLLLMAQLRDLGRVRWLRALHIDHGLQAASVGWSEHAQHICRGLKLPMVIRRVDVGVEGVASSGGPEAAARKARYDVFSEVLRPGEHLLLAQHAEDQAETFLLQALRGSGPDGLASIPRKRRFAQGYMARPLLVCSQESLQELATQQSLHWIEDPSNLDHRFDRNYLRHQVIPLLKARWPGATETLSRSAMRSAASSQSLLIMAREDLEQLQIPGTTELSITAIKALPRERAFTALRLFIRQRGLRMPRLQDLMQVMSNLVYARPDSGGIVNVRDYVIRRHRDKLYLLPPQTSPAPFRYEWHPPFKPLTIRETGLTITLELCQRQGIAMPTNGSISVKSRAGGELIKLGEPAYHKSVKKILQESAIPPWVRETIPLLYMDGHLAAIWNIAVAVDCSVAFIAPDSYHDGSVLTSGASPERESDSARSRKESSALF